MKYSAKNTALSQIDSNIILAVFEDGELSPTAMQFDQLSQGYLTRLIQVGEVSGKQGQVLILRDIPNCQAQRIFIVGCGKKDKITERQYKQIIQKQFKRFLRLKQVKL